MNWTEYNGRGTARFCVTKCSATREDFGPNSYPSFACFDWHAHPLLFLLLPCSAVSKKNAARSGIPQRRASDDTYSGRATIPLPFDDSLWSVFEARHVRLPSLVLTTILESLVRWRRTYFCRLLRIHCSCSSKRLPRQGSTLLPHRCADARSQRLGVSEHLSVVHHSICQQSLKPFI